MFGFPFCCLPVPSPPIGGGGLLGLVQGPVPDSHRVRSPGVRDVVLRTWTGPVGGAASPTRAGLTSKISVVRNTAIGSLLYMPTARHQTAHRPATQPRTAGLTRPR